MVSNKDSLKHEVHELEALVELYIKSNPNYKRKDNVEEKKVEEVVVEKKVVDEASIHHAFQLMANVFLINNVVGSPHHIAVVSGEHWHAIDHLMKLVNECKNVEINTTSYDKSNWSKKAAEFASAFTKLSQKSGDNVNEKGTTVSFANLHSFLDEAVDKLPAKIADNSHHEVHVMAASVAVAEEKPQVAETKEEPAMEVAAQVSAE